MNKNIIHPFTPLIVLTNSCIISLIIPSLILIYNLYRILKKKGQVIISTPNVNFSWKIIWWLWSHTFGRKWLNLHTNEFNEITLVKLFSKYFKIKNIRKVNHWILILECVKI